MGVIPAGMNFWNPWQMWQKLSFVLGSAIFFVFLIGFAVKFRNARKIRKLEARAAADMAECGEIIERASEEVPFGVRAIEAGDEVDGIWNSKAATPLQCPSPKTFSEPSTPSIKPPKLQKAKKGGSGSSLSKFELPEPAHARSLRPADAPTPSAISSNTLIPTPQAAHLTVPQMAQTPCPVGRRRIAIGGRAASQENSDKPLVAIVSNSIERMQAHRRQLSAETGQLQRRVRRVLSASSKFAAAAAAPSSDNSSDFTESKTVSWPGSKSESSATPLDIRHEIVPLPSSAEGDSSLTRAPPTAWTQRTGDLLGEKLEEAKSKALTSTVSLMPANLSHLNENHRIVNEGFEVMPAGTLAKPVGVKEFGLRPEQSIKLVSEGFAKPARKLQKRNRSRSGSRSQRSSSDGVLSDRENKYFSCESQA